MEYPISRIVNYECRVCCSKILVDSTDNRLVVPCDHCGAEYKLTPSDIQYKITYDILSQFAANKL